MPSATPDQPLEIGLLLTGLGGGLAIFLFGMRMMTDAMKTAAGGKLKDLAAKLTSNRFSAAAAGAIVTAVLQSSSVTTVLVVGFVSSGLLTLSQSIGVIIGANIGSTVTAQIIAFKVTESALLLIAFGFLVESLTKRKIHRQLGVALMGLGMIFLGMNLMSAATSPLRTWPAFVELMQDIQQPLWGVLAGLVFTALVQSSAATTSLVMVLGSQGLLPLEAGIAIVFGANIGTCVTALLSSIGRPIEAKQSTAAHIVFNVLGVAIWLAFIPPFAELVREISPTARGLEGAAKMAAEIPRQVANAHTLFNVANALLFIGFTTPLARLVKRLLPSPPGKEEAGAPRYLDDYYLDQPSTALDRVDRELSRLAELVASMLARALPVAVRGKQEEIDTLRQDDDAVDRLHAAIVAYLGELSMRELVEDDQERLGRSLRIATYLENVGDVIEESFAAAGEKRIAAGLKVGEGTERELEGLHQGVVAAFDSACRALRSHDPEAARAAAGSKQKVAELGERVRDRLAAKLATYKGARLELFQMESDLVENLKRLNTLTRRIGRALLEG